MLSRMKSSLLAVSTGLNPFDFGPQEYVEMGWRYGLAFLVLVGHLYWPPRPRNSRVTGSAVEASVSDAAWSLPIYVWGVASLWHAFSWQFLEHRRGIAPNEFYFVLRQVISTIIALAIVAVGSFLAESRAWRAARLDRPPGSVPLTTVVVLASVAMAWMGLVAIIGGSCWFFYEPSPQ